MRFTSSLIKRKSKKVSRLALQFENERKTLINRAIYICSAMCSIFVPLFGLLDLIFKPHLFYVLLVMRLGVTVICISILFLSKLSFGMRHPYALTLTVALVVCVAISMMCFIDDGASDPYYAGINLIIVGMGIMFPFTLPESVFMGIMIWLSYFLPNVMIKEPQETTIFINNNFFLLSTIIISIVGTQFNLRSRKNQWNAHRRLKLAHRRIKSHAKELEDKVKERTQRLLQSERLAVVGQLAGGIAHDFNNLLTSILGISELLLNTMEKKDRIRGDIESIHRVSIRAADLIKQLLAFSRRQILMPKVLNLNDEIKEIESLLQRLIGENIELIIDTSTDTGNVRVDPVQIEQILFNLCVNARDAMPDGGRLFIETENMTLTNTYCSIKNLSVPPGEYVVVAVSDTGTGMSQEVQTKIFEPFFTTKEKGKGTGLGLSTVYGIVKQSNGDIIVYSEQNSGTTFKIFLPRIKQDTGSTQLKKKKNQLPRGTETILVVEDEDDVRDITVRMLKKQGYKVLSAKEGNQALDVSDNYKGTIDLLVTDVIMPVMNGKALAEKLSSRRETIKVLFLSGYTDSMISHQGVLNENTLFLAKPFTLETLSHKIRNIFDN